MRQAELQPITDVGRRFVALAEMHAKEAAERADRHDRDGSFPVEVFDSMKTSGFLTATIPEEFGGLGLSSVHDLTVGLARLGYGDGSTAIAADMHLDFGLQGQRSLRQAREEGDSAQANAVADHLQALGAGAVAMYNGSEPGTDLRHPLVEGLKVDGGWLLTGRKIFATLSPIADLFAVSFRVRDGWEGREGDDLAAYAFIPKGTDGQIIHDNWDALGMRASGSHDVSYRDCFVPEASVQLMGRWGEESEIGLVVASGGNLGLVGCFVGIAEAARDLVIDMVRTRTKAPRNRPIAERHGIQHQVAEMEADLATCRAHLSRQGQILDQELFVRSPSEVSLDELHELNAQFQCAKLVVNRRCIEIVDRALTISGGAGYLTASPLSRMYRDVRAGPFMQPFSPNEAYEYIGKVTLGLPPDVEG
jgi:alkylation response protein AidB-like acyl-CoA dehydrogenase